MAKKKRNNNNSKKKKNTINKGSNNNDAEKEALTEQSPKISEDTAPVDNAVVEESTTAPPSPEQLQALVVESAPSETEAPVDPSPPDDAKNETSEDVSTAPPVTESNVDTETATVVDDSTEKEAAEPTSVDLTTEPSDEAILAQEEKKDEALVEQEKASAAEEEPTVLETDDTVKSREEVEEQVATEAESDEKEKVEPGAEVTAADTVDDVSEEKVVVEKQVEAADSVENQTVDDDAGEVSNLPNDGEDALPIERGIDHSPSDELGPAPPVRMDDVVSDVEPTKDAAHALGTESKDDPSQAPEMRLKVETKIETKPSEASTVVLDNSGAAPAPMEPVKEVDATNAVETAEAEVSPAEKQLEKPTDVAPTVTFAQAFGSPNSEPASKETDAKEKDLTVDTTPRGLTFAQAFGSNPISPLATPASVSKDASSEALQPIEPLGSTKSSSSSHSALSASKNKKVQGLVSKYMEEVKHEPLPGDAIPIRKKNSEPSPANSMSYASHDTPLSAQSIREKVAVTEVELAQLPKITTVRDKFESSSRSTGSEPVFEFGESFRQKKRFEQLSDKERQEEAKIAMRGFNERDLYPGKVATGEIDTSSLGKVYTFEMSANASMDLPPDGTCRVDYKKADYTSMVFVVHRTLGMLLLYVGDGANQKSQIPCGQIQEKEFLDAAQKSGSGNVQLQIAAREAAARQLFENTGLDIRGHIDRFKPAILRLNPPVDAKGVQYLKNEYNNRLYYFLQVDEQDFAAISESDASGKLTRPSEDPGDSPLALRLRDNYNGFTFILDPSDAAKILKEDGSKEATHALRMIMNEASSEGVPSSSGPDAKATEYSVGDSAPDDEKADRVPSPNNIRTVGETSPGKPSSGDAMASFHDEAALNIKSSSDTNDHVDGVTCCCGWW